MFLNNGKRKIVGRFVIGSLLMPINSACSRESDKAPAIPSIYRDFDCNDEKMPDIHKFRGLNDADILLICEGNQAYAIPAQVIFASSRKGWLIRRTECGHVFMDIDSNVLLPMYENLAKLNLQEFSGDSDTIGKTCFIQVKAPGRKYRVAFNENFDNVSRYTSTKKGGRWFQALEILNAMPTGHGYRLILNEGEKIPDTD